MLNKAFNDIKNKSLRELTPLEIIILGESNESLQMAGADQLAFLLAELDEARRVIENLCKCTDTERTWSKQFFQDAINWLHKHSRT